MVEFFIAATVAIQTFFVVFMIVTTRNIRGIYQIINKQGDLESAQNEFNRKIAEAHGKNTVLIERIVTTLNDMTSRG